MIKNINNYIYNLYSLAAYEFSESAKWMPSWLLEHPAFKKTDRVFKIFETFGLKDFREKAPIYASVNQFKNKLIDYVLESIKTMNSDDKESVNRVKQVGYALIDELTDHKTWLGPKNRILNQISSSDKKLRIDAGTSVIKAYNRIAQEVNKLGGSAPPIELSEEFKEYGKRGDLTVVFSTNPEDIAAMSSRSDWGSCQSLGPEYSKIKGCVIGSALSKFVGIIYITNEMPFEERGEKILSRSLVRFLIDIKSGKPIIFLDKMYPSHNQSYAEAMINSLQKRTNIPVRDFSSDEGEYAQETTFKLPYEKIPELRRHETSYLDYPDLIEEDKEFYSNIIGSELLPILEKSSLTRFQIADMLSDELTHDPSASPDLYNLVSRIYNETRNNIIAEISENLKTLRIRKPEFIKKIKYLLENDFEGKYRKVIYKSVSKIINHYVDLGRYDTSGKNINKIKSQITLYLYNLILKNLDI